MMLIIFDCDGVLVDSEPLANASFSESLKAEGLDWTVEETMRRLMGRSLKSCGEIVENELGRKLPGDFFDKMQARLWDLFGGRVFSSSQVPRGKPFPDLFLHAALSMNVQPFDSIVVEDSVPGIQAAKSAGMRALAYAGAPYADRDALAKAGGFLFGDMKDLPELVLQ